MLHRRMGAIYSAWCYPMSAGYILRTLCVVIYCFRVTEVTKAEYEESCDVCSTSAMCVAVHIGCRMRWDKEHAVGQGDNSKEV
jgi:hypothetical protein